MMILLQPLLPQQQRQHASLSGRLAALLVAFILVLGIAFHTTPRLWSLPSTLRAGGGSKDLRLPLTTVKSKLNVSYAPENFASKSSAFAHVLSQKSPDVSSVNDGDSVKVKVKILVEALCVWSQKFFAEQLVPAFNDLGPSGVMDLQVVVFGNTEVNFDDKGDVQIECQHGVAECDANAYHLCAAELYPFPERYLPYQACLFENLPMGYHEQALDTSLFAECARKTALHWTGGIASCHANPDTVLALQLKAFFDTSADHEYVPWVEIAGNHVEMDDDASLKDLVCKNYRAAGGNHPICAEE